MIPTIFDCETGALPMEQLLARMPQFSAPSNYKDEAKITANVAAQKQTWLDDCALSPLTGRVLAFGYIGPSGFDLIGDDDESTLLKMAWAECDSVLSTGGKLVGFCCNSFDLPFMVKRSWALSVPVPRIIGAWSGRYWNWSEDIIDLRLIWQLGDKQAHGGLDDISKFLGGPGKSGSGKDFAMLWNSDREKAISYLKSDCELTLSLYHRMCQ